MVEHKTLSNRMGFAIAIRPRFESDARRTVHHFRGVHRFDLVDDGNTWNRSRHGATDVDRTGSQEIAAFADSQRRHGFANCWIVSDRGDSLVGLLFGGPRCDA